MIRHIVAVDSQRGIAKNGNIPWNFPDEKQYFKQLTMSQGGVVLMGRKTYETIGKPLAGRQNFVLSRDSTREIPGVTVLANLEAFMRSQSDIWVIGGAELYEQTLAMSHELYVTEIAHDFECDQFYPTVPSDFYEESAESHTKNGHHLIYKLYKRR